MSELSLQTSENLSAFRSEIIDNLDALNILLLRFETQYLSESEINEIKRLLHNIKGHSHFLQQAEACEAANMLESLIAHIDNGIYGKDHLIDLILESCSELTEFYKKMIITPDAKIIADFSFLKELIRKLALFVNTDSREENNNLQLNQIKKKDEIISPPEKRVIENLVHKEYPEFDFSAIDQETTDMFITEAEEMLNNFSEILLHLENNRKDMEKINHVFRVLHTLKGSSGMMDAKSIYYLGHSLEELLDLVRNNKMVFTDSIFDIMFEGLDKISSLIKKLSNKENPNENVDEMLTRILYIKDGYGHSGLDIPKRKKEEVHSDINSYRDKTGNIELSQNVSENKSEKIMEIKKDIPAQTNASANTNPQQIDSSPQTLRIDIKKLDTTMNRMGELVIEKIKLQTYSKEFLLYEMKLLRMKESVLEEKIEKEEFADKIVEIIGEVEKQRDKLNLITEGIERLSSELQDGLMKMRLVPLSQIFSRFPRVVRDLSKQLDKKINFIISGDETEIDKNIIEKLVDPLVHLIRNCIDHGIESESERKKIVKKIEGSIHLRAFYKGNDVVIQIDDDGAGLNIDKIKNKSLEKNLLPADELEKMSDEEIMMLIFRPGFSTAEKVTDLSGRGVGMDVVKKSIEALNGSVALKSERGKYTSVIISIPLTLAIMQVLLIKIGNRPMAIPLYQIQETVFLNRNDIYELSNKLVFNLRGIVTPLIILKDVIGIESNIYSNCNETDRPPLEVVVIPFGDKSYGLLVDKLEGKQEIVIKTLGSLLEKAPFVSGATTMGDGSVILILDIISVIKNAARFKTKNIDFACENANAPKSEIALNKKSEKKEFLKSVLVVDDSPSVRTYLKKILESMNIAVDEAENGSIALSKAKKKKYDLMTIDLMMPVMDGFQLCEELRRIERYKLTPLVAVSGKSENISKKNAFDKGMNEYIVKPPERELVEMIVKKALQL